MPRLARYALVLLMLLPLSCAGPLEEGEPMRPARDSAQPSTAATETVVFLPQPGQKPVPIDRQEFEATLEWLVASTRLAQSRPEQGRIVPASWEEPSPAMREMVRQYNLWCQRRHEPDDCLELLTGGRQYLGEKERITLAVHLALGVVYDEMLEALRHEADPQKAVLLLGTYVATYLVLWFAPEPVVSKVLAIGTTLLLAYETAGGILDIAQGFLRLRRAAVEATSFQELRDAGEPFGKVLGVNGARAVVMIVTASLGKGAELLGKLSRLPGIGQAALRLVEGSGGRMTLGSLGQAEQVLVGSGQVAVVLSPAAGATGLTVAMAGVGDKGGGASGNIRPARKGPGKWVKAERVAKGRAAVYQAWRTGHPATEAYEVAGVEFDGYDEDEGVLLDAKGLRYDEFFLDDLEPKYWFKKSKTGVKDLLARAKRQTTASKAVGNVPIRWEVAEAKAAQAIKKLLKDNDYLNITVVHRPMPR